MPIYVAHSRRLLPCHSREGMWLNKVLLQRRYAPLIDFFLGFNASSVSVSKSTKNGPNNSDWLLVSRVGY